MSRREVTTTCQGCGEQFEQTTASYESKFCCNLCLRRYVRKVERQAAHLASEAQKPIWSGTVGARLPTEAIPDYAVFPWVRRCCIDQVIRKHAPGADKRQVRQQFQGLRDIDGILTAVYRVEVRA